MTTLLEKLNAFNPKLYKSANGLSAIRTLKLIETGKQTFEPDVLYMGTNADLETFANHGGTHLILITDEALPDYFEKNPPFNLLKIEGEISFNAVFNTIQDIFDNKTKHSLDSEILLDSLAQGQGIQHIIDMAFPLIGNPMMVLDKSFKLLAYTKNITVNDPMWTELTTKGFFSYETVSLMKHKRALEKVNNSKLPVLFLSKEKIKDDHSNSNYSVFPLLSETSVSQVLSSINIKGKAVGRVVIMEVLQPIKDEDIDLLTLLCKVISSEMQKNKFLINSKGIMYEYFLADLLSKKIKDSKVIHERLMYLDCNFKKNLCILTIRPSQFDLANIPLSYIRDMVGSLISFSKPIIYEDNVVILISRSIDTPFHEIDFEYMFGFLNENNLHAGLSRTFQDLTETYKFYQQSLTAMDIGVKSSQEKVFFEYEKYLINYVIALCSSYTDLKDLCHPSLLTLIDYDRKNKTNFTQTLYTFIENSKKLIETANILHIHRNTMSLRIEKIQEIMEVDLDDINFLLHLQFSFKVLDYINKLNLNND